MRRFLYFGQSINVDHIIHKADDSCDRNELVALNCTEDGRGERADALANCNGHALALIGLSLFQHGKVQQAHSNILQIGGILFAFHTAEPVVE